MPLSLTRAGALNGSRVRSTGAEIVASDKTGSLAAFLRLAAASAFSTNVDASKVEAFDAHSAILDARSIKIHQVGGDAVEGLRAFNAQPDPWLARRKAFEALWRDGSRFVYGAVNAGGMESSCRSARSASSSRTRHQRRMQPRCSPVTAFSATAPRQATSIATAPAARPSLGGIAVTP